MASEYYVGGGLVYAAGSVHVGRHATAGLIHHQLPSVLGLTHDFVAGRQVDQHRGAGQRLCRARRRRHPKVFADLHAEHEPVGILRGEEAVRPEGDDGPEDANFAAPRGRGAGEPSALVKLLVIRNERLGDEAEELAPVDHRRAIEELVANDKWKSDDGDPGENVGAGFLHLFEAGQGAALKRGLLKEVAARVAGEAQFRKNDDADALGLRPSQHTNDAFGVVRAIADPQQRRGGGDAQETVWEHGIAYNTRRIISAMLLYRLAPR
jgi:hypothetical protein